MIEIIPYVVVGMFVEHFLGIAGLIVKHIFLKIKKK